MSPPDAAVAPHPAAAVVQVIASAADALALDLDNARTSTLAAYVDLLGRWNRVYNLTATREPVAIAEQHVVDCLAAVPSLRRRCETSGCRRVLDVGSGAGLPGLVIAVAVSEVEVTCLEPIGKKAAFIRQAAARLGLRNVTVENRRAEDLSADPHYCLIVARAFASLAELVGKTRHVLAPTGEWAAMKARDVDREARELVPEGVTFHVEPLAPPGSSAIRHLVWLKPERASATEPQ